MSARLRRDGDPSGMRWWRRILLVTVVLAAAAAVAAVRGQWPQLEEGARRALERALARELALPVAVGRLSLSPAGLAVTVEEVRVGARDEVARVGTLRVALDPGATLWRLRPVLRVEGEAVEADLTAVPRGGHGEPPGLPPVRLSRVRIDGLRLRFPMDAGPGELRADRVEAGSRAAGSARWFDGTLRLQTAELQRRSRVVRIEALELAGEAGGDGVFLRSGRARGEGLDLEAAPVRAGDAVAVRGSFRPAVLGVLVDELAAIDGLATVDGHLGAALVPPVFDARLTVVDGGIAGRPVGALHARARIRGPALAFSDVHVVGPGGVLRGDVTLVLRGPVPIRVDAAGTEVDLAAILAAAGVDAPVATALEGNATLRGDLDPLDIVVTGGGQMRVRGATVPPAETAWEADLWAQPHRLALRLAARQARNAAEGELLLDGNTVGGGIAVSFGEVAEAVPLLPRPVSVLVARGELRARARLTGSPARPALAGDFGGRDLRLRGALLEQVGGSFRIDGSGLTVGDGVVGTAAGRVTGSGRVALRPLQENDWRVRLDTLDTDAALALVAAVTGRELPVGGGRLAGTVGCTGPWVRAACTATLEGQQLRLAAEPFEQVTASASSTLPRWELRVEARRTATEMLRVAAGGVGFDRMDLEVRTDAMRLPAAVTAGGWLGGQVRAEGRLAGPPRQLTGDLAIGVRELTVRGQSVGTLSARLEARRGDWRLDGALPQAGIALRAALPLATGGPASLEAQWRDLEIGPLVVADGALSVRSDGSADLRAAGLDPATAVGTVRIDSLTVRRGSHVLRAPEPALVRVERGRFAIDDAILEGPRTRLVAGGYWSAGGEADVALRGEGDLALLELGTLPVRSARGPVTVSARVRHRPGEGWDLGGEARIRDGAVDVGLPLVWTGIDAHLSMQGAVVTIRELRGRAGTGSFAVEGTADLERGPALAWSVSNVTVAAPAWLEERFSATGTLEGRWEALLLRAAVHVDHALYTRDVAITDLLPWLRRELAVPPPPPDASRRRLALDVRISAPDSLYVENNYARAELRADLQVGGTLEAPEVTGVIEVLGGTVTVNKRAFTLTGGTVDFRDPTRINPALNLAAETQILTREGLYLVTATVTGTADAPRVQLASDDPSLTQNDILSLIATGRTARQTTQDGAGFSPVSALALVPTRGFRDVLSGTIGLDLFELDTGRVEDTGPVLPRVTVGKQLTEELRVTASSTLVETLTRVTLDYRVGRRLSVFGTWESQGRYAAGAFGGGGTLRYGFRGSPFSLLRDLQLPAPPTHGP